MNTETRAYVLSHLTSDVRQLALQGCKDAAVDFPFALQQIAGRQRIRHKLPEIYNNPDWLLPPTLNLEQASSELTAQYKAKLIQTKFSSNTLTSLCDLTGGSGIDTYYCSKGLKSIHYVDRNPDLCDLARHNMPLAEVHNEQSEDFLQRMSPVDVILLDPARRDTAGRKVAALHDCTPDAIDLLPLLLQKSKLLLLKLSPMLDWHQALRDLGGAWEVHILSVANDCKELLLLRQSTVVPSADIPVYAVDLQWNQQFNFTLAEEEQIQVHYADGVGTYLYEPNAALMKAGAFRSLSRMGAHPIAPNTHLYTSDQLIPDFPGRIFQVEAAMPFNKDTQKRAKMLGKAQISCRNFPLSPDQLRKKLALKDGGETQIIGFSDKNNANLLVFSKKM